MVNELGGDAAENQPGHGAEASGPRHDQVHVLGFRVFDELLCRLTESRDLCGLKTHPRNFLRAPTALLSGPAGGVIGAAAVAAAAGVERALGFDMGGTSTDVSLVRSGEVERVFETVVGGVRVKAPMLRIHTVAAGGGSLCRFDGFRFTVGPESAGADPGPLCYGRPEARELLKGMAEAIAERDYGRIVVRGHTDTDRIVKPETRERFPHGNRTVAKSTALACLATSRTVPRLPLAAGV